VRQTYIFCSHTKSSPFDHPAKHQHHKSQTYTGNLHIFKYMHICKYTGSFPQPPSDLWVRESHHRWLRERILPAYAPR